MRDEGRRARSLRAPKRDSTSDKGIPPEPSLENRKSRIEVTGGMSPRPCGVPQRLLTSDNRNVNGT